MWNKDHGCYYIDLISMRNRQLPQTMLSIKIYTTKRQPEMIPFNSYNNQMCKLNSYPISHYRPPNPLFVTSKNPVPYIEMKPLLQQIANLRGRITQLQSQHEICQKAPQSNIQDNRKQQKCSESDDNEWQIGSLCSKRQQSLYEILLNSEQNIDQQHVKMDKQELKETLQSFLNNEGNKQNQQWNNLLSPQTVFQILQNSKNRKESLLIEKKDLIQKLQREQQKNIFYRNQHKELTKLMSEIEELKKLDYEDGQMHKYLIGLRNRYIQIWMRKRQIFTQFHPTK